MFTSDQRDLVRRRLLRLAEEDSRITGAAVTGSAADGREDRWSDVDLFFGVADPAGLHAVVADWSGHLYGELGALHHFDCGSPVPSTAPFSCRRAWRSTSGSPRPTGSARPGRGSGPCSARSPRHDRSPRPTRGT